jgi:2'-5' RNA ligase
MLKEGLWPGPVRFEPHVTLLWDERRVPGTILDEPIGWTARDFALVRSFYGQRRQVDLGTWPLDLPTPPTAGDRRA